MDANISIFELAQKHWVEALVVLLFVFSFFKKSRQTEFSKNSAKTIKRGFDHVGASIEIKTVELTPNDPCYQEIVQSIKEGNKISAIKILREAKGLSLLDAKTLVETLERSLQ